MELTEENLEFPCELKEKIIKMINTSRIKVEFVNGRKLIINKTNIAIENPSKIIFSNNTYYLEALLYLGFNDFYVKNFDEPLSLNRLASFVNKHL
jgi:hypothetical protein